MPPHVPASDPWQRIRIRMPQLDGWNLLSQLKIPSTSVPWDALIYILQPSCETYAGKKRWRTHSKPPATCHFWKFAPHRWSYVDGWKVMNILMQSSSQNPRFFPQLDQHHFSQSDHKSVSICKALSFLMFDFTPETPCTNAPTPTSSIGKQKIHRGSKESLLHNVIPCIESQTPRSCCQMLDTFLEILYDSPKSWLGFVMFS